MYLGSIMGVTMACTLKGKCTNGMIVLKMLFVAGKGGLNLEKRCAQFNFRENVWVFVFW